MVNVHRLYFEATDSVVKFLKGKGIAVTKGYSSLTIKDDATNFVEVYSFLMEREAEDFIVSNFSTIEIENADFLKWSPTWQPLYPMPKDDFGYLDLTYDLLQYCEHCGVGKRQKQSFRLANSPNWGQNSIFILHWVFDEVFCTKELYELIFRKYGIKAIDVLRYGSDVVLPDVVQLELPIANSILDIEEYPSSICPKCYRAKYELINSGFFPRFKSSIDKELHFFKSIEDFSGGGTESRKYLFISKRLRAELEEMKIKSRLHPCIS